MTGLFVYRNPSYRIERIYRIGPFEDGEAASAMGYLLFGRPLYNDVGIVWFTGIWDRPHPEGREYLEYTGWDILPAAL